MLEYMKTPLKMSKNIFYHSAGDYQLQGKPKLLQWLPNFLLCR